MKATFPGRRHEQQHDFAASVADLGAGRMLFAVGAVSGTILSFEMGVLYTTFQRSERTRPS